MHPRHEGARAQRVWQDLRWRRTSGRSFCASKRAARPCSSETLAWHVVSLEAVLSPMQCNMPDCTHAHTHTHTANTRRQTPLAEPRASRRRARPETGTSQHACAVVRPWCGRWRADRAAHVGAAVGRIRSDGAFIAFLRATADQRVRPPHRRVVSRYGMSGMEGRGGGTQGKRDGGAYVRPSAALVHAPCGRGPQSRCRCGSVCAGTRCVMCTRRSEGARGLTGG